MNQSLRLMVLFLLFLAIDAHGAAFNPMSSATDDSTSSRSGGAAMSNGSTATQAVRRAGRSEARVVNAYVDHHGHKTKRFSLGSTIVVEVENLQELKRYEVGDRKIVLFLNGIPIRGLVREDLNLATGQVRYRIALEETTKAGLDQLICKPHFSIPTAVTLGFEDEFTIPTDVADRNAMQFQVINPYGFAGWIIFTATMALLFIHLAKNTSLLRTAGMESCYSLANSQMAFWTLLVCSGYVFICLIRLENPDVSSSMLIILGISAGTALSGKVIDAGKPVPASKGNFLEDILQDVDGYTVARLQIFTWTIIMGVIFVVNVYSRLAMPEFGTTLLTLMGISSGTYIGFKIPEDRVAPHVQVPQPPTGNKV